MLSVEDALSLSHFSRDNAVTLSPNGERVACTITNNRRRQTMGSGSARYFTHNGVTIEAIGCGILVAPTGGNRRGETRRVGAEGANSWCPAWSPDSRYLAFYSDSDGLARLWIWDSCEDTLHRVSPRVVRTYFHLEQPVWSGDGRFLLTKFLPDGMSIEQANDLIQGTPKTVGEGEKSSKPTVTVYSSHITEVHSEATETESKTNDFRLRYLSDLFLIDVKNGQEILLAGRVTPNWFRFSPDFRTVAFMEMTGYSPTNSEQIHFDLKIVDLSSSKLRTLVSGIPLHFGTTVSWSPDSSRLAYTTSGPERTGYCHLVNVADGKTVPIAAETSPFLGNPLRPPLWNESGDCLYVFAVGFWRLVLPGEDEPRGRAELLVDLPNEPIIGALTHAGGSRLAVMDEQKATLLITRSELDKTISILYFDLETRRRERRYTGAKNIEIDPVRGLERAESAEIVAFPGEDAKNGPDIWVMRAPFVEPPYRITEINPSLEKVVFGDSRLLRWQDTEGNQHQGALLLPSDFESGKQYPLIVFLHPNPRTYHSDKIHHFDMSAEGGGTGNLQLFATRGMVVFMPNCNVSTWQQFHEIYHPTNSGIDALVDEGMVDPDRIGVIGQSGGGYAVLALLVQSNRFKAAVASASYGNLITSATHLSEGGSTFWMSYNKYRIGADFWRERNRYIENSPVFFLDKVETPLLLVHGSLDETTPIHFAEETYASLCYLGKEVTLARYEGEEHWPGEWGYANQKDYWERVLSWFSRLLSF
jgi:dipeptidyl aminopeptidase/acylaminoacyl peptidase